MTRPEIAYSVQTLSQFLQDPKHTHMEATLRIVKYLKQQPVKEVLLSSNGSLLMTAYCDADRASCPMSRRSVTGYLIKLGNSLITWKSKKQINVSRSSTESEYRSLATTLSEIIWLSGLLKELEWNSISLWKSIVIAKQQCRLLSILFTMKGPST
ncbi:secreted RxLR effector protein 161-like [Solanum dulcamara]|uniref:secreted RxLR effector protein 161-like n=1 Tax=Solanum dulcamara TaxID=45834 RepID=UPI0024862C55|nr:secreted RxLR effector protein 161-like [Solanum dulcamara]